MNILRILFAKKEHHNKAGRDSGTAHHWFMQVSAVVLMFLTPVVIYIWGVAIGDSREEVLATFGNPIVAIFTALTLIVTLVHFANGAQMVAEDYMHGKVRKAAIFFIFAGSYALIAVGLLALGLIVF